MKKESEVHQCSQGHFVCGLCVRTCPTCRGNMMGRCHGFEEYLQSLNINLRVEVRFSDQNSFILFHLHFEVILIGNSSLKWSTIPALHFIKLNEYKYIFFHIFYNLNFGMKTLFYLYLCWSATTGQVESQQLDEEYLPAKSYETIPKVSSLKILWSMIS